MKKLYSNIGDVLCKDALLIGFFGIACVVIGIIVSVIGVLVLFFAGEAAVIICGIGLILLGLFFLNGSKPLYAFGQITNDIHALKTDSPAQNPAIRFTDLPEL